MNFWDVLQWILSTSGIVGVIFTFILHFKLEEQKHNLDKLKSKFEQLLLKRTEIVIAINTCVSDIEVWMRQAQRLESAQDIDINAFRRLVLRYESTLIHGGYILSSELLKATNELCNSFIRCIEIYDEECEKIEFEPIPCSPEDAFANKLYQDL